MDARAQYRLHTNHFDQRPSLVARATMGRPRTPNVYAIDISQLTLC
jgi:hypothetical protein